MKTFIKVQVLVLLLTGITFSQGWVQLNSGTSSNLTFIQFLDANTGFVGSPLLRTTNAGANWTAINMPATPTSVFFVDINNGYLCTGNPQGYGSIYKTTNGGLNWNALNVGAFNVTNSIYFFNKDTGYCVGILSEIKVYKTADGGSSWNNICNMGIYDDFFGVTQIFFINQNEGYLNDVDNSQWNWPPTYQAQLYRTQNGGQNWGMYLTSYPSIYCSAFDDVSIPQPNSGFVIFDGCSGIDSIRHCNGTYSFQGSNSVISVSCPDPAHTWAVGNSGTIYATNDGGISWFGQNSGVSSKLNKVCFVNNSTGFVVGDSGTILKTNTGGEIPLTISGQVRFQDNNQPVNTGCVKALHYDRIADRIITVDSTSIQSNGTYSLIHVPPQDSLYIMAFENDESMLAFVPTYYPSSTTWQNATVLYATGNLSNINVLVYRINNTGGPYHISGHIFENTGNPLLGLNQSVVYAKVGNDFKAYSISDFSGLYRIDSLPSATYTLTVDRIGYSPMNRSVMISNYSKDTIDITFNMVGVVNKENYIPKSYVLGNNYPNPFNPETKIAFGIPHASNTKLIIYDILGREVATLINENLEAGSYNIEWNAANCSSGIYFYKLASGDFVQTKKMVLIK